MVTTSIQSPGIFLTLNYTAALEFTNQVVANPNISIESIPNLADSIIISGKTNKYLESLEYSWNYDSKKVGKVVLTFIDTDGNFEQNFFMHRIIAAKEMLNKVLAFEAARKKSNQNNPERAGRALLQAEDLASQYKKIWISFGLGTSLNDWSDIHSFFLQESNLTIDKGMRRYTFTFLADYSVFFRPRLQFNLMDPNPEKEFLYTDNIENLYAAIEINQSEDTITNVISRLVKKYLSIITSTPEDNIIAILPCIDLKEPSNQNSVNDPSKPLTIFNPSDVEEKLLFGSERYYSPRVKRLLEDFAINIKPLQSFLTNHQASMVSKNGMPPPPDVGIATQETNNLLGEKFLFSFECFKLNSSISPGFPDFYEPLNKLNIAYKKYLNTADDFVVIYENNIKLLKYWENLGLIKNASDKCIIFGLDQMISEWLYRNYIPIGSESSVNFVTPEILKDFKPTFEICNSKEAEILNKDPFNYAIDILSLLNRGKSNSNFQEKINIDELAISNDTVSKFTTIFKTAGNLLELFDIPVFTHNLKNSNILDLTLFNTDLYLASLRQAISTNVAQYFVGAVKQNLDLINIEGVTPTSVLQTYQTLFSTLLNEYSDSIGSKEIRNIIIKLIQKQYLIAKKRGIEFTEEYINNNGKNFITALFRLKAPQVKIGEATLPKRYISPPAPDQKLNLILTETENIYEDQATTENRLNQELGITISQDKIDKFISTIELFLGQFDKLILKNGGNIDIDKLLIALAVKATSKQSELIDENQRDMLDATLKTQENYYNYANLLTSLYDISMPNSDSHNGQIITEGMVYRVKEHGLTQDNIAAELWKYLNQQTTKLSIKTLPFFHVSSPRKVHFKPCFVFSKKVNPIISNQNNGDNNQLEYFSGLYHITAFKHVINTKECYSEFLLQKDLGNAYRT